MSANKEIVERVRQKFLKEYGTNPQLYHENDIKNIRENDWPIERFILVNSNEEKALQAVIKAMQWRKSFGIHSFNDNYFPIEIYKINSVSVSGRDKEGRPLVWGIGRNYAKWGELDTLMRQYWVYQFEKVDRQTSHQGWVFIADMSGTGLSNINTEFNNAITEFLQNYYPRAMKYMISVELPFLLNAASKIWVTFMNEELKGITKFIKKEEVFNYVNKDMVPVNLNGTHSDLRNEVPIGGKRFDQLPYLGLTSKQIEKIYSTFKCLKEN